MYHPTAKKRITQGKSAATITDTNELLKNIMNNPKLSDDEKIYQIKLYNDELVYEPALRKQTNLMKSDIEEAKKKGKRCHFFCEDLCYNPFRCCIYSCGICLQIFIFMVLTVGLIWLVGYYWGFNKPVNK